MLEHWRAKGVLSRDVDEWLLQRAAVRSAPHQPSVEHTHAYQDCYHGPWHCLPVFYIHVVTHESVR